MSLTNKNILTIINNCFKLPPEITTEYETVIAKFMQRKEHDAGHRGELPCHTEKARISSQTDRSTQIARNILMYLSTVEYATMQKIQQHSSTNMSATKSCVSNLFTKGRINKVRAHGVAGKFFNYSIAEGEQI